MLLQGVNKVITSLINVFAVHLCCVHTFIKPLDSQLDIIIEGRPSCAKLAMFALQIPFYTEYLYPIQIDCKHFIFFFFFDFLNSIAYYTYHLIILIECLKIIEAFYRFICNYRSILFCLQPCKQSKNTKNNVLCNIELIN